MWILTIIFKIGNPLNDTNRTQILMDDLSDVSWYLNAYPDENIERVSIDRPE